VAIGRAIVREPKLFLFDEPLSNLDAKLRNEMRLETARLHRRLKGTTLYVTHDQVAAMTLATRIVVINEGRIEQIGTPDEIYSRPATKFVAGFVGTPSMNFIPGRVEGGRFVSDALSLPVGASREGPAELGVRPEDLRLEPGHGEGRIELIENLGTDRYAHILCGGQRLVVRLSLDAAEGDTVPLSANPARVHVF
jgi:ABC-type sugar transport system ATPase subunit